MPFKKSLLLTTCVLIFLCTPMPGAFAKGPKAVIPKKHHNFGKVWQGDTASHVFKLKNEGGMELRIENLEILGPYSTVILKRTVPPGQTVDITIAQDTEKVAGEVQTGAILYTNDPAQPKIELKMSGKVSPILEVQPMRAMFFSPYKGQAPEKSVTIVNYYNKPITVVRVEAASTRFQAQLKTLKEGREYRLLVQVNPEAPPGRTMEAVNLFTDSTKIPKIEVGVNIFIRDEVFHFPDQIDFGKIELNTLKQKPDLVSLLKQTVMVKRREGKSGDFQILLQHDIPFIQIKKEPESGSDTYRLDITPIMEKMKPGKIDAFIRVKTNDKEVPELKIPVVGEVL